MALDHTAVGAALIVGYSGVLWLTGKSFSSLDDFAERLNQEEVVARSMSFLLSGLTLNVVLRGVAAVLFRGPTAGHYNEHEVTKVVAPVLIFNMITVPLATGPDPFDAVLWNKWFTVCAGLAGFNALVRMFCTAQVAEQVAGGWGERTSIEVALAATALFTNGCGLFWLLQKGGLMSITPIIWIKWGHDILKEVITSCRTLAQLYIKTCGGGYVFGRSVAGVVFDVDSYSKIMWRVLHLFSSIYLLWVDSFGTIVVDVLVYFRLRSSWRILGVEIAKRLSRADVTSKIDSLYPEMKVTDCDDNDCPICWEEMPVASVLPCKHRFHRDCLRDWVKDQGTCPTCRHPINMVAATGGGARDDYWHRLLRRLFSLGGPTPQEIEQMTLQLHRVFPNVAVAAIEHDLVLTGSVEVTADRLTRGQVY